MLLTLGALIPGLSICHAGNKELEGAADGGTTGKEIREMIARDEWVRIEVGETDLSWGRFKELLVQAAEQSKEVILQDEMRALVVSFTRPWRKKVRYHVVGAEPDPESLPKSEMQLVCCEFDEKGIGSLQGKKQGIEDYLKSNPEEKVVIVCRFPDDMKLKTAFSAMFRLSAFGNVIDFVFPQDH